MKAGMAWPIGIVVILSTTVIANLAVMRIANNDPAFAIEPDYYKKAVAFDSTMAQERRSNALGWVASTRIAPVTDGAATRLHVTLRDEASQPVVGATVLVTALFNARANALINATLVEDSAGVYSAPMAISTPGEWEVRITATRDTSHFMTSLRTTVTVAAPSRGNNGVVTETRADTP